MTPSFRHIPLAAQPSMPWQNGGGVTRQVAIDPPAATLATGFRWRVSVAQVSQGGPFSSLPGIDRSLWLVRGNGMRLRISDRDVVLNRPLQRVDFAGEQAVSAELIDGACEDCNVMTRRGVVRADAGIELFAVEETRELSACVQRLVLVLSGRVAMASPTGADRLELLAGDAALVESKNAALLSSLQRSAALSIAIDPIP